MAKKGFALGFLNFHITLQPISQDDAFGGFLLLISGHPDGHEQGSHQGDLKVFLVIMNMMMMRMEGLMMIVMVVVMEQIHIPHKCAQERGLRRARARI